jgi:hypothetical protein
MPRKTEATPAVQPLEVFRPVEELLRDFFYHQVSSATAQKMAALRESYYALACEVVGFLPYSRERSLALTHLEESCMRAIQCLAVTEGERIPIGEVKV